MPYIHSLYKLRPVARAMPRTETVESNITFPWYLKILIFQTLIYKFGFRNLFMGKKGNCYKQNYCSTLMALQ